MGITRDSIHKRRLTGGKKRFWRKKRKHEMGRQSSNTKIGSKQVALVRVRGGNIKKRALRLDSGNFSWITTGATKKSRIISVVYNASSNELVRTNTLVKGAIIYVDASPFKSMIQEKKKSTYKKDSFEKNKVEEKEEFDTNLKTDKFLFNNFEKTMENQFDSGKLLARICSRPGQIGRADGYILEKAELEFYLKKIQKKKKA